MWNTPLKEQLAKIPRLYETEKTPLRDKLVYLHFFLGGSDWFITEFDGEDTFFGYALINNDTDNAEWGYVSFQELKELKIFPCFEIDCEVFEKPRKAADINRIPSINNNLLQ